mgnify:CR=1 FL=1|tara:strand:- start:31 stop:681 length:651 start_codon:yes stop_codon:yes gene_type:complete
MKYLIALLLITNLTYSQEWSETKLNDFSSIKFPNKPEKTIQNTDIYYSASDDYGVYLVMIRNLGNRKISESELPEFYEGFMNGALKSVSGELIKQNDFKTNGINGNEMIYLANSNPQLPNLRHKRIFIANNNLISCEFWTNKDIEQLASINKEKFFNSISVSIKKGIETKKKETNSEYESGFLFGKIISFLLIIGLIIGGILLIRKLTRKKNKNVG